MANSEDTERIWVDRAGVGIGEFLNFIDESERKCVKLKEFV